MKFNYFFIPLLCIGMMSSCSNEDDDSMLKNETGRFDNKPFVWDVISTTNSNNVYVGDLDVPNDASVRGNVDDVIISAPSGIYVGGVYPTSSIDKGLFDSELQRSRNPIDLIFEFNDPYIDEVTRETGSVGYLLALKRALRSYEYTSHINASVANSTDYMITEFYSYNDLQKLFKGNTSLFKLFTSNVDMNRHTTKIKSKTVARLVNVNFTASMDFPTEGIFKDGYVGTSSSHSRPSSDSNNSYSRPSSNSNNSYSRSYSGRPDSGENSYSYSRPTTNTTSNVSDVFIKSMSYGKVVYLVIESEYSYSEVKKVIEASVSAKFGSAGGTMTQHEKNILSRSSVTICVINSETNNSYFLESFENLGPLFKTQYNTTSYGRPVYIQLRSLKNESYTPSSNDNSGSYSRPSGGSSSSYSRPSGGSSGSSSYSRPSGRK